MAPGRRNPTVPFAAKPSEGGQKNQHMAHQANIFDFVLTSITIGSPKGKESPDLTIDINFLDITCCIKDVHYYVPR
jgi:hypothetical protein